MTSAAWASESQERALHPPPLLVTRTARTLREDADAPLRRISIELSRRCNLRCTYCYANASPDASDGLTEDEVRSVIVEAIGVGARLVSIVGGGEPLLRRALLEDGLSCIDYANERGCYCVLYTNATRVGERASSWLASRDVSVVAKLNSLRPEVQDALAGRAGASDEIRRGIDALLEAGLAAKDAPRLGLETIICRDNYDELPSMWRWMRERNIVPEVEIPTMHGRARENERDLFFDPREAPARYKALFEALLEIDRNEFGFDWIPHPPFAGMSCRLFYSNCYVNARGGVQPCAGVERELGVLRVGERAQEGRALASIVRSPPFAKLRRVHEHLQPPCRGCDLLHTCYGCRGAAWNQTGDMFSGDPVCWRTPAASPCGR